MVARRRKSVKKKRRRRKVAEPRVDLTSILEQLREHAHDLAIQFRRIADIQADLDEIKRAWVKLTRKPGSRR